MLQMSYPYMTSVNIIALIILNFFSIVTTLLLKMLHDLLSFLQTSKHHLISWLQSSSAVILEPPKIKSHCFNCFPIYLPWSDGTKCHDLHFLNEEFKPDISLFSFTFIKRLFSFSSCSAMRVVTSAYMRLLIFLPTNVIPACASSSWAFHMMYSAYNLNKQGGNILPLHTLSGFGSSLLFHVYF